MARVPARAVPIMAMCTGIRLRGEGEGGVCACGKAMRTRPLKRMASARIPCQGLAVKTVNLLVGVEPSQCFLLRMIAKIDFPNQIAREP